MKSRLFAAVAALILSSSGPSMAQTPADLIQAADEALARVRNVQDYQAEMRWTGPGPSGQTSSMVAVLYVDHQPLRLHLIETAPSRGTEAIWPAGDGQQWMYARRQGRKFVTVHVQGRAAKQESSRPVYESGLLPLNQALANAARQHAGQPGVKITKGTTTIDGRPCECWIVEHPQWTILVHSDAAYGFVVRYDLMQGGQVVESCEYSKIRLNVGLPDSMFQRR